MGWNVKVILFLLVVLLIALFILSIPPSLLATDIGMYLVVLITVNLLIAAIGLVRFGPWQD
jgi:hypothetical protein